jgi:hypothetical protein
MSVFGYRILASLAVLAAIWIALGMIFRPNPVERRVFDSIMEDISQQDEVITLIGQAQFTEDAGMTARALDAIARRFEQPFESETKFRRMQIIQINFYAHVASLRRDLELLATAFEIEHELDHLRDPETTPGYFARSHHIARLASLFSTRAKINSNTADFQQANILYVRAIDLIDENAPRAIAKDFVWERAVVLAQWGKQSADIELLDQSSAEFVFYRDASIDIDATVLARRAQIEISWNALARSEITGDASALPDFLTALEDTMDSALPYLLELEQERIRPAADALRAAIIADLAN